MRPAARFAGTFGLVSDLIGGPVGGPAGGPVGGRQRPWARGRREAEREVSAGRRGYNGGDEGPVITGRPALERRTA
jgi:hypothetical protein